LNPETLAVMYKKLLFLSAIGLCFTAFVVVAQDNLIQEDPESSFFCTISDVSVFLNAYSGKDYYNMHFQQRLSVVRVGLQAFAFR